MQLNRFNQIIIEESDELLEEQWQCPKCNSKVYSSIYSEKISTANNLSWIISTDSMQNISQMFFCKCGCGNQWLEKYIVDHHRPQIRYTWMRNFGGPQ